ncbi:hypothetical protein ACT7DP_30080 [Bacillus paranthracis]
MEAWKSKYTGKEIRDKMGISRNVYYKILENLNIPTNSLGQGKRKSIEDLTILSDEEMSKYTNNFIDFSLFKNIPRNQQITLFESYLKDFPVQSELAKVWGADLKYVYYISSLSRKQKQKEEKESNLKVIESPSDNNDTILSYDEFKLLSDEKQRELLIYWRGKYLTADIKKRMGVSDGTMHSLVSRLDVPRIKGRKGLSTSVESIVDEKSDNVTDNSHDKSDIKENAVSIDSEDISRNIESQEENAIEVAVESQEDNIMEETRQNEENDNSLTIEIKGNYSTNAIMKSIQSILTTLESEEEVVDINLKVRKR